MEESQFEAGVNSLESTLMATIQSFFAMRGMPFDAEAFLNQSSASFDQIARDAFFFGADTFPSIDAMAAAA